MHSRIVRAFALVGLLAVGACDDALTPGELNEEEAEDLASAVLSSAFVSSLSFAQPAAAPEGGPATVPYEYSESFQTTVSCPLGGNAAVDASIDVSGDDETGEEAFDLMVTLVHNACVVQSERGRRFTLTGNPDLTFELMAESDAEGNITMGGAMSGALDWQHESRTGTCSIAYEFSGSASGENSFAFEFGGSVCGVNVQRSFSVGG